MSNLQILSLQKYLRDNLSSDNFSVYAKVRNNRFGTLSGDHKDVAKTLINCFNRLGYKTISKQIDNWSELVSRGVKNYLPSTIHWVTQ